MYAIPYVFAFALCAPQEPPPSPADDLPALAARIDGAHHPRGPVPEITAFRSTLELHLEDKDAAQAGRVELDVQFLQWRDPARDRVRPLIRYMVKDAGSPIVRGRDRNGPWQLFQDHAENLRQAQFADDLAACERHTNLARQLLRFLDPGSVLRALTNPSAVTTAELAIERGTRITCQVVEGDLPAFPLLQQGGDDAPVRLKIYVDRSNGQLAAIEACPLVDGAPATERMERVVLRDLHEQDDLLVPRSISHLFRIPDGRFKLQTTTVLTALSLRPELRAEDFDRPK
jgi:hypothetical protein